jgi:hypothetical protein
MRQELEHASRGDRHRVLRMTVKNAFRSKATARSVSGRHRPATNSRYRPASPSPSR